MHKDPPPPLLKRPISYIAIVGIVVGFIASILFCATAGLLAAHRASDHGMRQPLPAVNR